MKKPTVLLAVIAPFAVLLLLISPVVGASFLQSGLSGSGNDISSRVKEVWSSSPGASPSSTVYRVASGLVYSDSLTTGDLHYWIMNGSAVVVHAPHSFQENASGLILNLLAPSAGGWGGFYGVSPLTPAHLFHAKISLGHARPTSGLLDTAVYVQQQMTQDPRIDAVGCGADIYPNLTHWTISLQAGDQWHEIVPQTVYVDNSQDQPTSRDCTIVTDGNTTLTAYIDNQKVFSSNKMDLNMPEPLQYYLEVQTNSLTPSTGSNFTGMFSDYYATSSDSVTVLNVKPGYILKIVDAVTGNVLTSSIADGSGQVKMNVGMYHMPINANIQVFDHNGASLVASTNNEASGMYGGDVYNVGSPDVHNPTIEIISYDKSPSSAKTAESFEGAYTKVSSVSSSFVDYTPFVFTATPFQPYIISITDDRYHTFMNWKDGAHTFVRVLTPTTADQDLSAYYSSSSSQVPPPDSLTSLTQYTTNSTTPSITGIGIPGYSVQLYDNGSPIGSPVIVPDNGIWVANTTALADGTHIFTATQGDLTNPSDTSAQSRPITMTIDTALPSIKMSGSYTISDHASISGTATDSIVGVRAVDLRIDNATHYVPATQTIVGDWSKWSFESTKLFPGSHTVTARVTNLAGSQAFASMTLNIPPPDPSVTVSSVDTQGSPITGIWTVFRQEGYVVQTGYTPIDIKTISGHPYSITVDNFASNYFDHWANAVTGEDIASSNNTITLASISNPVQLEAVFRHTPSPPGSYIIVNATDLKSGPIDGMYVSLSDASHKGRIQTGFTPTSFATTSGFQYVLNAADYGTNYFDHWHNVVTGQDSASRSLVIDATSSTTEIIAVYRNTP